MSGYAGEHDSAVESITHSSSSSDSDDEKCKEPELLTTRPQKKKKITLKDRVEKLLLLYQSENPGEDLLGVFYSKRYRKEVMDILKRMMDAELYEVSSRVDLKELMIEGFKPLPKCQQRLAGHESTSWHLVCDAEVYEVSSRVDLKELMVEGFKPLRKCQQRLAVHESTSWHLVCYPLPQDLISLPDDDDELLDTLNWVVYHGTPVYRDGGRTNDIPSWLVNDGMADDTEGGGTQPPNKACEVVSLLSSCADDQLVAQKGNRIALNVDTFRSKFVLVCCISMPTLSGSCGFQSLLNLCQELDSGRDDVQMVMVGMTYNILFDTEQLFNHAFSGFPHSCLAVPYDNWERRENICKLLNWGAGADWGAGENRCLVYDTNGLFLTSFAVRDFKISYGAEAFPFTQEMTMKIREEHRQLRRGRLENLLRPYENSPPDVVVYEFDVLRKRTISEVIKNKHVGLFVCCEGDLIPLLHDLYEQCKERGQEFEIVVLYCPSVSKLHPESFRKKIDGLLGKEKICGWWCLPFNNSVSLRFSDLTWNYYCSGGAPNTARGSDKLIIVGPDGYILEMYGSDLIKNHGIHDTYPFTREAIVLKKMSKVLVLRLESLLAGPLFRGDHPYHAILGRHLLALKMRIIILMDGNVSEGLVSQYREMKKRGEKFEVVFIERGDKFEVVDAMPWYVYRSPDGTRTQLAEELMQLFDRRSSGLVGFGRDGRICSVKQLSEGFSLEDTLFHDIYHMFGFHEYADI